MDFDPRRHHSAANHCTQAGLTHAVIRRPTGLHAPPPWSARRRTKQPDSHQRAIPVITSYRQKVKPPVFRRSRVLAAVRKTPNAVSNEAHTAQANPHIIPSLYLLNAAAITKPHAVEQLAVDVTNHGCDIAVITETHCKTKHTDSVLHIPGYTLHRRDRLRRRGGGVAVYVRDTIQSTVWTAAKEDRAFELHWQKLGAW